LVVLFSRLGRRGGDEGPDVSDGGEPIVLDLEMSADRALRDRLLEAAFSTIRAFGLVVPERAR
jgi:hypothetical protein